MRILAHRVVPHWAPALFLTLATLAGACRKPVSQDVGREIRARLETAEKMADLSQFEEAARLGFEALSLAESSRGVEAKRLAGESHTVLSRVYLLALQDSLAWDHACAAEQLSQHSGQCGFEDVGRIHGAAGTARTHKGMDLVDE